MPFPKEIKYPDTTVKKELTVTLGGRAWVFAPLPPRRYRLVVPLLCKLLGNIGALAEFFKPSNETAKPDFIGMLASLSKSFSEEMIDDLSRAYYLTLLRNYPELTEDEWFEDTPVSMMEMITHFMLVANMAGLMPNKGAKRDEGGKELPGEVIAES